MTRRAYGIIVACFFTVSIAYGIRYAYGMLLPEMLPALGISKTGAGVIFSVYFVVYTMASPVLGSISDLFNYRLIIFLFSAILAAGAFLMASVEGLSQACIIFSVAGLGHAACWAPVAALVSKWVPDHKRVRALSFATMGVGIGIILWGTVIPIIVSASDWRAGWRAMGMFGGGVALLNWALIRNPRDLALPRIQITDRLRDLWNDYKGFFRNKTFWVIGISYLLVGFNVLVPFTYLPIYAREALHLTYATSTRYIAVIALFGIFGQMALGLLSDTVGRVRVMIVCSIIMGMGCLALTVFRSLWGVYACAAFYGLGYGAVWPAYAAAASDYFHKSRIGSVVGLWTVFLGIGSFFSPILCGWIIDSTSGYFWIFVLGWVGGILSALTLLPLSRRLPAVANLKIRRRPS